MTTINHNILQKIADKKDQQTIDEIKQELIYLIMSSYVFSLKFEETSQISNQLVEPIFVLFDEYSTGTTNRLAMNIGVHNDRYMCCSGYIIERIAGIHSILTIEEFKKYDDPYKVINNRRRQNQKLFFLYGKNIYPVPFNVSTSQVIV